MRFIYPNNPFDPAQPDETYAEEHAAAIAREMAVSLFSYEEFLAGSFKVKPRLEAGELICYRGWMLSPREYGDLCRAVEQVGGKMMTNPAAYERCHYLPGWYSLLSDLTPETFFLAETDDVATALRERGWEGCFLKDYVKSLSTAGGSLIRDLETIPEVVAKMKKFRGVIEGGLCVRRIEDLVPETEERYFAFRGVVYTREGKVPDFVADVASRVESPFFSIDTSLRKDGEIRIIELGDGQVSDRKRWPVDLFLRIFRPETA